MSRMRLSLLCAFALMSCSSDSPSTGKDESPSKESDDDSKPEESDDDTDTDTESKPDAGKKRDASAPPAKDSGSAPSKDDAGGDVDEEEDAGPSKPSNDGPADGDPSKPVVSIADVKCGGPGGSIGGSINPLGSANLQVGGRDVILTYPCDKHEGAKVVFILNLHGTMETESLKFYQHGYFAAHALTNSHNVIVATPKSRASQWGNTSKNSAASEDRQHLLDVIDYVYTNLGKFDITSLWVGGHSWGAMYAKRFVCEEAIKDKVHGVIGMSGGTTSPGGGFSVGGSDLVLTNNCQDYIGQIHTVGDTDMVAGLPDQSAAATKHGCDAKQPAKDLGDMQMSEEWPNCDAGWVHEGITMGAHSHTTSINPEVVKHIVEQIKKAEAR